MNGKLIAALAIVFVLAVAFLFVGRQQEAMGQKPEKAVQWEHKVIFVPTPPITVHREISSVSDRLVKALEEKQKKEIERLGKQLNELGADGWEYAGEVYQQPMREPLGATAYIDGVFLAFKRPKR
jgi:hypothetical protein